MAISYGVVGRAWRFRAADGRVFEFTGAYISTPAGARPGSYWVEADGFHYIDEYGDERRIYGPSYGQKPGRPGSYWIESTFWAWLDEFAVKHLSHDDVAHADTHGDVLHSDSHGDVPHTDTHGDVLHSDTHTDVAHTDTHGDVAHSDRHSDYSDYSDYDDYLDYFNYANHSDHSDHSDGGGGGGCLRAGTLVAVWNEQRQTWEEWPVETLRPGMYLYDYDERTSRYLVTRLIELRDIGARDYHIRIETDGGPPTDVTFEQLFDVRVPAPDGWIVRTVRAPEIQPGWQMIRPLEPGGLRYVTVTRVTTVFEPGARFYWPITETGGYIADGYDDGKAVLIL